MEEEMLSTRLRTRHAGHQSNDAGSLTNANEEVCNGQSTGPDVSSSTSAESKGKGSRSSTRKRKSSLVEGNQICPVCGITVRPSEIEQHFRYEVQQIDQIVRRRRVVRDTQASYLLSKEREKAERSRGSKRMKTRKQRRWKEESDSDSEALSDSDSSTSGEIDANLLLLEVRGNRHARERKKELLQNPVCNPDTMLCPVCFLPLIGSEVDRNRHVENCLSGGPSTTASAANGGLEDAVDVDGEGAGSGQPEAEEGVEGDGESEENSYDIYEWMGETRVRAVSLVPGGYQRLGYQVTPSRRSTDVNDEDDIDLNVDGDETEEFGPQQYTEEDVLARCPSRSSHDTGDVGYEDHVNDNLLIEGCLGDQAACSDEKSETENENFPKKHVGLPTKGIHMVVESLKERVRELEEISGDGRGRLKCQICMGTYNSPLVSVQCWHVHCEDCWFKTLASKKLCPQCQMITAPSQLRKIYL